MIFPDPNIGYIFGYNSSIEGDTIAVTFLGGLVKIPFRFRDIQKFGRMKYRGRRISWDVIRWGKCPRGTEALQISLKKGLFRNHLIVFPDINRAVSILKKKIPGKLNRIRK